MRKKIVLCLLFVLIGLLILAGASYVFGASLGDDAIKKVLYELHQDGLDQRTMHGFGVSGLFRSFGFFIVKCLASIIEAVQAGLTKVVGFLSFVKSDSLSAYINSYYSVFKALLGVSICFLGLHFFLKPADKDGNIVQNLIICILIITVLPTMSGLLSDLTKSASEDVINDGIISDLGPEVTYIDQYGNPITKTNPTSSIAQIVFSDNVVDLLRVDDTISEENLTPWRNSDGGYNTLSGSTWRNIDINQHIEYKESSNKKLWQNALSDPSSQSSALSQVADDGTFHVHFIDDCYYRYQIKSWFAIIIQEILIAVVLVFTTFKIALLIINVAQALIFMPFVAVTDLATGQRIKETIKGLISLFAAIYLAIVLLGAFFIGYKYIMGLDDYSFIVKSILIVALTAAVIDGPDLIERIIGVDVGVKSGFRTALATYGIGKAVTGTVSKIGKGAKTIGGGALAYARGNGNKNKDGTFNPLHNQKASHDTASALERERSNSGLNTSSSEGASTPTKEAYGSSSASFSSQDTASAIHDVPNDSGSSLSSEDAGSAYGFNGLSDDVYTGESDSDYSQNSNLKGTPIDTEGGNRNNTINAERPPKMRPFNEDKKAPLKNEAKSALGSHGSRENAHKESFGKSQGEHTESAKPSASDKPLASNGREEATSNPHEVSEKPNNETPTLRENAHKESFGKSQGEHTESAKPNASDKPLASNDNEAAVSRENAHKESFGKSQGEHTESAKPNTSDKPLTSNDKGEAISEPRVVSSDRNNSLNNGQNEVRREAGNTTSSVGSSKETSSHDTPFESSREKGGSYESSFSGSSSSSQGSALDSHERSGSDFNYVSSPFEVEDKGSKSYSESRSSVGGGERFSNSGKPASNQPKVFDSSSSSSYVPKSPEHNTYRANASSQNTPNNRYIPIEDDVRHMKNQNAYREASNEVTNAKPRKPVRKRRKATANTHARNTAKRLDGTIKQENSIKDNPFEVRGGNDEKK